MKQIWGRIHSWLQENAPMVYDTLQRGADQQQISTAAQVLGITFPEDLRNCYEIHNGQRVAEYDGSVYGLFDAYEFLSLSRMIQQWNSWKELLDRGHFKGIQSDPLGPVRTDWWNPMWIPFAHNGLGDNYCSDLAPLAGGAPGQIITMWHDQPTRRVLASSLRLFLEAFADQLEAGKYVFSEEFGGLMKKSDLD